MKTLINILAILVLASAFQACSKNDSTVNPGTVDKKLQITGDLNESYVAFDSVYHMTLTQGGITSDYMAIKILPKTTANDVQRELINITFRGLTLVSSGIEMPKVGSYSFSNSGMGGGDIPKNQMSCSYYSPLNTDLNPFTQEGYVFNEGSITITSSSETVIKGTINAKGYYVKSGFPATYDYNRKSSVNYTFEAVKSARQM